MKFNPGNMRVLLVTRRTGLDIEVSPGWVMLPLMKEVHNLGVLLDPGLLLINGSGSQKCFFISFGW